MSLEIDVVTDCDVPSCRARIKEGEAVVCWECYVKLGNEFDAANDEIQELKQKMALLQTAWQPLAIYPSSDGTEILK